MACSRTTVRRGDPPVLRTHRSRSEMVQGIIFRNRKGTVYWVMLSFLRITSTLPRSSLLVEISVLILLTPCMTVE